MVRAVTDRPELAQLRPLAIVCRSALTDHRPLTAVWLPASATQRPVLTSVVLSPRLLPIRCSMCGVRTVRIHCLQKSDRVYSLSSTNIYSPSDSLLRCSPSGVLSILVFQRDQSKSCFCFLVPHCGRARAGKPCKSLWSGGLLFPSSDELRLGMCSAGVFISRGEPLKTEAC